MADFVVIPDVDPIPLPAPVWLLKALLLLTFLLHIIPMNLVLGGGLTSFVTEVLGRRRGSEYHLRLARSFARMIPVAVAFAITLGVAPLLFLQVLYGQLFYTSTILMAWPWLAVIALVILGYYGFYLYSYRWQRWRGVRLLDRLFDLSIGARAQDETDDQQYAENPCDSYEPAQHIVRYLAREHDTGNRPGFSQ